MDSNAIRRSARKNGRAEPRRLCAAVTAKLGYAAMIAVAGPSHRLSRPRQAACAHHLRAAVRQIATFAETPIVMTSPSSGRRTAHADKRRK